MTIAIYGAGGHAKVIADIALELNIDIQYFIDIKPIEPIFSIPVVLPENALAKNLPHIIALGNNAVREKVANSLATTFTILVHPKATISKHSILGEGTVVMAGATVNAATVVGKHCIINTNASIDHDCTLGDYVHISPNATLCGTVTVAHGTHIGAGATVIPNISIGNNCVVGAGSVVIRNVPDNCVVVGNPARVIKKL